MVGVRLWSRFVELFRFGRRTLHINLGGSWLFAVCLGHAVCDLAQDL